MSTGGREDIRRQTVIDQNDPEERLIESLMPLLKDRNLLDVGANRGVFTAEMLRIGFNRIHAFEPHPDLSRALELEYFDDPRVTVHPIALSETEGPAMLHLVERTSSDLAEVDPLLFSSLKPHNMSLGLKFEGGVSIECRTLASLAASKEIPDEAAVLKIDAEGCDFSVIQGMPKDVPYEVIMTEFWSEDFVFFSHDVPAQQVVCDYLREHGYPFFVSIIRRQDGSLCFEANIISKVSKSWGNTLYFHDSRLFYAAYAFMSNTMYQVSQTSS
jgi:FkbM family methyltransferase